MAGLLFYLTAWCLWIYSTFFLERKSPQRLGIAIAILAVIILAPYQVQVMSLNINIGSLLLFFYSLSFLRGEKVSDIAYFYVCSLILSIAYGVIQMFFLFDPVIFFVDKDILSAFIMGILAIFLRNSLAKRFLLVLFASLQGEFLTSIVLVQFGFPYEAGGYVFLDYTATAGLLIIFWSAFETTASILGTIFKPIERGNKLPHD
ncbi:hypothetical protein AM500_10130 [Bacillus sp. FJAT-18017]|uniref:YphA family membrane protein n=1 Tax=Bacillus sp. FJAT-18017 TaxID=1705566 RepID=UPI0006B01432|nr:hypothetical protein [Bacillus sp. FJAT-18017]ALC90103.1 hypothetical protein AM500_10130 [Bacillus sp. FJAT-18017]